MLTFKIKIEKIRIGPSMYLIGWMGWGQVSDLTIVFRRFDLYDSDSNSINFGPSPE